MTGRLRGNARRDGAARGERFIADVYHALAGAGYLRRYSKGTTR